MKGRMQQTMSVITAAVLVLFLAGIALAKTTEKEETKLTNEISRIDSYSAQQQGDLVVLDRLSKAFKVPVDKVSALHEKMGYGEIAAIYAFADKLPGGAIEDNVSKVTSLREDDTGWMSIAQSLDVDLGKVAGKVKDIGKDAGSEIKKLSSTSAGGMGAGAGGGASNDPLSRDRSDPLYN